MFASGSTMGAGSRYTSFQGGALSIFIIDGGPIQRRDLQKTKRSGLREHFTPSHLLPSS